MYLSSTFKCGQTNEKARKTDEKRWFSAAYDLPMDPPDRPAILHNQRPAGHVIGGREFWVGGLAKIGSRALQGHTAALGSEARE